MLGKVSELASSRVESPTASVALEMLGLLMGDEEFQIFKVSLACAC